MVPMPMVRMIGHKHAPLIEPQQRG
jgi:hypothetical protein